MNDAVASPNAIRDVRTTDLSTENDLASNGMAPINANGWVNPVISVSAQTKYFLVASRCVELPVTVSAINICHFMFPMFPMLLSLAAGTKTTIKPAMIANMEEFVALFAIAVIATAVEIQISEVINELASAMNSIGKTTTKSATNRSRKLK
jgi:hypothetical protein